ncbi:hypothetical protein [Pedosphaera parvula]|uniref:3-keto-disaccharide hydrolase domain-containing protein n=1 Tax=Pedosphaera parvula (strain Ellin514) TaxID=320771 RepID=B9XN49_PEDPL|nr:hypothetical protein [Pedosphaera parvula]EEF58711.1 hypothetical protein Cflav_PD1807 [Pedosphaera parvula Ellin514]
MTRTLQTAAFLFLTLSQLHAQVGSLDPETLPATIRSDTKVHFISIDGSFKAANTNWQPTLHILTGGDHATEPVTIGGHTGVKVNGIKFNTADDSYQLWASQHTIDILMQVYGDEALVDEHGKPRYFNFLTGTLPEPIAVDGGTVTKELVNKKWNWVLFRIPNGLRHMDGGRLVGTIHPKAKGDSNIAGVSRLSGQNGGTIRMDGLHDLKVRFVAFGEKGAFGELEQINGSVQK